MHIVLFFILKKQNKKQKNGLSSWVAASSVARFITRLEMYKLISM